MQITISIPESHMGAGGVTTPDYPGPHSFLVLSVVITTICGILNLLSLACGVPAIILAGLVSDYFVDKG